MTPNFDDVIRRYRPAGYEVVRRKTTANDGLTEFRRYVTVSSDLVGRDAIFVALHEFGHIVHAHMRKKNAKALPPWLEEYEADQYAINIMRKEGIAIPRDRLMAQKEIVHDHIMADGSSEVPNDAILKYAFGRDWRNHR